MHEHDTDPEPIGIYPRIRDALRKSVDDTERRANGDAFRRADPDFAQFVADALGIELTDTQRLILTDGSGDRFTLGQPIPHRRSHDLTQSQRIRGARPSLVVHDEAPADGDGNPLPAGIRAELDAQLRFRAEFYHGLAVRPRDAIVHVHP